LLFDNNLGYKAFI